ncbi:MAG: MarR family transcriptional regulator [Lachnospiraceae bacterium]|nr:MarR family transcriptional regulator [Lachnospiraceae bacterium]
MDEGIELLLNGQQYKRFQEKCLGPIAEEYELSVLELRLLRFLDAHQYLDTAKDIIKVRHWTKSHVSKAIENLIERGYLRRQIDERDRRKVHLTIQEQADPLLVRIRQEYQTMHQVVLQGISQEEQQVVAQVAKKISSNITGFKNKDRLKN